MLKKEDNCADLFQKKFETDWEDECEGKNECNFTLAQPQYFNNENQRPECFEEFA